VTLLENASEALNESQQKKLVLETKVQNGTVGLSVLDTGSGIPLGVKRHVFDSGFTTKERKTSPGLSHCKALVEKYSGFISFDSLESIGTEFIIKFPLDN